MTTRRSGRTKTAPRSKQELSRKLIDRLAEGELGELEAVLATTYELELSFFELDFLPSVLGLGALDDRLWGSRVAVERKLASMSAVVLLGDSDCYRGRPRSLRIEHQPVHFGGGRLLHAKVLLLVHAKGVRLFVGSANLTSNGYRRNREAVTTLIASEDDPRAAHLIRQAVEPMPDLFRHHWTPGAKAVAELALARLAPLDPGPGDGCERFLWGGGTQPLHEKFLAMWPEREPVQRVAIVSPFWSEEERQGPLHRLLDGLRQRGALGTRVDVELFARDDGVKPLKPTFPGSWARLDLAEYGARAVVHAVDPLVSASELGFTPEPGAEPRRDLHAKVVLLEGPKTSLAYVGSANFTTRGFGFVGSGHVEAGLAFLRSDERAPLQRLLPRTIGDPVSLPARAGAFQEKSEPEGGLPWPSFLVGVRLAPARDDSSRLELAFQLDPAAERPEDLELGEVVRDADTVRLEGRLATLDDLLAGTSEGRSPLDELTLGRLLGAQEVAVKWPASPVPRAFPLNVDAAARHRLPVTPSTSAPGESHLLAYYQGRIAWPELFPDPDERATPSASSIDRTQYGVDTSRIQSYQVREFVDALPGLRGDLEEASRSTPAGMKLALLGQVSPVALARTVVEAIGSGRRSPTAGAFQLVELLLILGEARTLEVEPARRDAWAQVVEQARAEIEALFGKVRQEHLDHFARNKEFLRYEQVVLAGTRGLA